MPSPPGWTAQSQHSNRSSVRPRARPPGSRGTYTRLQQPVLRCRPPSRSKALRDVDLAVVGLQRPGGASLWALSCCAGTVPITRALQSVGFDAEPPLAGSLHAIQSLRLRTRRRGPSRRRSKGKRRNRHALGPADDGPDRRKANGHVTTVAGMQEPTTPAPRARRARDSRTSRGDPTRGADGRASRATRSDRGGP
jgi:hypothetical protein